MKTRRVARNRVCAVVYFALLFVLGLPLSVAAEGLADIKGSYDSLSLEGRRQALSLIAEDSLERLLNVPLVGLRGSEGDLGRVRAHRAWLEASVAPRARLLALYLQQGVDRVVIAELYREGARRSGKTPGRSVVPDSIDGPLAKKWLDRNALDPQSSLAYALGLDGILANSARDKGWTVGSFLGGQASLGGAMLGYEEELALTIATLLQEQPNLHLDSRQVADQVLAATAMGLDRSHDVRVFGEIYSDLEKAPKDRVAFDASVTRVLEANSYIRVTTAYESTSSDIEMTMRHYSHPVLEPFSQNLAAVLIPFVHTDYALPPGIFGGDPKYSRWRGLWLPK